MHPAVWTCPDASEEIIFPSVGYRVFNVLPKLTVGRHIHLLSWCALKPKSLTKLTVAHSISGAPPYPYAGAEWRLDGYWCELGVDGTDRCFFLVSRSGPLGGDVRVAVRPLAPLGVRTRSYCLIYGECFF